MQTRELVSPDTTTDEARLLPVMMATAKSPNEFIPDDTPIGLLSQYLKITSKAYLRAQDAVGKLKPFLGRILVLYKQHPELYKSQGFETYDKWMSEGVRREHGLNRGQAYECVNIAVQCGHLDSQTITDLKFSKLNVVAKIIKQSVAADATMEMRQEKVNEWVQVALSEGMTVSRLKEIAEEANVVEPGSLEPRVFVHIAVNPEVKTMWEAFVNSPEVQQYCGTQDQGAIFERSIQENCTEWQARGTVPSGAEG